MKAVSLIILVLCLLQPLACFAHPCDSCLGSSDIVDTSGKCESHPQNQDTDSCDSTICCEENFYLNSEIRVSYAPVVSVIITAERWQELPDIVIPIFVPPQSFA